MSKESSASDLHEFQQASRIVLLRLEEFPSQVSFFASPLSTLPSPPLSLQMSSVGTLTVSPSLLLSIPVTDSTHLQPRRLSNASSTCSTISLFSREEMSLSPQFHLGGKPLAVSKMDLAKLYYGRSVLDYLDALHATGSSLHPRESPFIRTVLLLKVCLLVTCLPASALKQLPSWDVRLFAFILTTYPPMTVCEVRTLLIDANLLNSLSPLDRETIDRYVCRTCVDEMKKTRQVFLHRLLVRRNPGLELSRD